MPEICDFTRDDGTTTVDLVRQAEGVLPDNEIQRLTNAQINQEPISECVASNESEIFIGSVSAESPAPNRIEAQAGVANNIASGEGVSITTTIEFTVDGTREDTTTLTLSPGETELVFFEYEGAPKGTYTICINPV